MEYKNQTENRAFQEMLQAAVKRLQNRSGEDKAHRWRWTIPPFADSFRIKASFSAILVIPAIH